MRADATVATADAEDIRDIRGPKTQADGWFWAVGVAATLLLAAIAYVIWRRRTRRPAPPLAADAAALARLDAIRPLLMPASGREYCRAASDIVRGYIEQRFDVIVSRRTTEEFLQDLLQSDAAPLAGHRGLLSEFLQQCDLVKFAGLSTGADDLESIDRTARRFIASTAPARSP